jgi:NAD(P)-dependent dehydrogenase (short-subunit alcohol dehydrogenase family)/acyl carrier protein
VHLLGLDVPAPSALSPEALEQAQRSSCAPVLHLVQSLSRSGKFDAYQLWIVTRGAVAAGAEPAPVSIAASTLWGLGRVIALEHPEAWGGLLDLAAEETADDAATVLAEIAGASGEDHIALRAGRRYVGRLVRGRLPEGSGPSLRADATYLITGGLGALGLRVAQWMVERGARHLVLTSRRGADDPAAQEALAGLERAGAEVWIRKADVADGPALARLLEEVDAGLPPLRGVVHTAGIVEDGILQRLEWGAFARVLAPKVQGTWNLHALTLGRPLDLFVTFSSATALVGAPGQASYAAGNAFMDALAHHRRALGLPALSVNWGPWADAGMAAKLQERLLQRLAGGGLGIIGPDQGLIALERLLAGSSPQVAVLPIAWETWAATLGRPLPLLRDLLTSAPPKASVAAGDAELLQKLVSSPYAEARELVQAHVAIEVARVLGMDDPTSLDPGRGFSELGMDSLMAVELKNRLQATLRRPLSPTVIFNHPSVTQLSELLLEMFSDRASAPSSRTLAPPSSRSWIQPPKMPDEDVSKISQLSEDDVASVISERFVARFRPQSS